MTTFAQRLWRDDVKTGRCSEREALQTFCAVVGEEDIDTQVNSMPEEMFSALRTLLQPEIDVNGKVEWPEQALQTSTSEMRAFDSDLQKVFPWKRQRFAMIFSAVQKRSNNSKAP
jgi:hypothetical protein